MWRNPRHGRPVALDFAMLIAHRLTQQPAAALRLGLSLDLPPGLVGEFQTGAVPSIIRRYAV